MSKVDWTVSLPETEENPEGWTPEQRAWLDSERERIRLIPFIYTETSHNTGMWGIAGVDGHENRRDRWPKLD